MPGEQVRALVSEVYGRPWQEVFSAIEPKPLGSASIAQVHVVGNNPIISYMIRITIYWVFIIKHCIPYFYCAKYRIKVISQITYGWRFYTRACKNCSARIIISPIIII